MVHAHSGSHTCLGEIQRSDPEPGELRVSSIALHIQCCLEPPICLPVSFITHPLRPPFFLMDENKTTVSIFIPSFLIQRSIMSITDIKMCLILLLWKKLLQHRDAMRVWLRDASLVCPLAHAAGMRFLLRDEVGNPCTRFLQDQGCCGLEISWHCLSVKEQRARGVFQCCLMSPVGVQLVFHPSQMAGYLLRPSLSCRV